MKYSSTRGGGAAVGFSAAVTAGLAADGGLFMPQTIVQCHADEFGRMESLAEIGTQLLQPYLQGDPLDAALADICRDAFDFPVPLRPLDDRRLGVLELFHGPTAAFKDVGARFLAASLSRLERERERPLTILVATSGDTGGAVAAAFHQRPGIEVAVLYPAGLVSPRQEHQLTCWGDNIHAFRVAGDFDACQSLVKQALAEPGDARLTSANSINIGRLLPQTVYYAAAALWHWREHRHPVSFIVPTGNLGNAFACVWAREMGLPIDRIVLATNANRTIPDYFDTGQWQPRATIATLASAMDVGNPSNMERLRHLHPRHQDICQDLSAYSVDDDQIRAAIRAEYRDRAEIWCPHTATAMHVYRQFSDELRAAHDWVVVATAHPAKFETIIEPLLGTTVPVPPALDRLLQRPTQYTEIAADVEAFRDALGL